MSDVETGIAARVRDILSVCGPDGPFITYQALASTLGLSPPGTIRNVAGALEQLMKEDVAAGRPMISALVVSRVGDMPRSGFFDLAVTLGRFLEEPGTHRAAWEAECAAVLQQASLGQRWRDRARQFTGYRTSASRSAVSGRSRPPRPRP